MSPYSQQVYFYDSSDSHSTDDLLKPSALLHSSSSRRLPKGAVDHTHSSSTDKLKETTAAATTTTSAAVDNAAVDDQLSKGLACWWLPKASKQPRHHAGHRSASRPQLVEDPFFTRSSTYNGQTGLVDRRLTREDSTRRAPVLRRVPDSACVQDSVSRPPPLASATAHFGSKRFSTTSSSRVVSTLSHKSSNHHHINNNVSTTSSSSSSIINNNHIMTPDARHHLQEETGSWEERPRSRSIAIVKRRATRNENDSSFDASSTAFDESPSDMSSTERMYDWATWCMYNRIIDHRRNSMTSSTPSNGSSPRLSLDESSSPQHHHHQSQQPFGLNGDVDPNDSSRSVTDASWDYCHDGEVFELEI